MVVFSAAAVAGEVAGVEEPEDMHRERMLGGERVHHHLQRQLREALLDFGDALS